MSSAGAMKPRPQLNPKVIDDFRFYFNDPTRSYTYFSEVSDLTGQMLRFMLCSQRIMDHLIEYVSTIYVDDGSFYFENSHEIRFVTTQMVTAAKILLIQHFDDDPFELEVSPLHAAVRAEWQILKLIYFAERNDVLLHLAPELRSRAEAQLVLDLGFNLETLDEEDAPIFYHYGVDPVPRRYWQGVDCRLELMNEIGEYRKEDRRRAYEDLPELWSTQKQILLRKPYLKDVFLPHVTSLRLRHYDFMTIFEYLPLPSMPHLKDVEASIRLQDVCPTYIDMFEETVFGLLSVAPKVKIQLLARVCINSRTFERHVPLMKDLMDRMNQLRQCIDGIRRPRIYLDVMIDTHFPVIEQPLRTEWAALMGEITEYYRLDYNPEHWMYQSIFNAHRTHFHRRVHYVEIHAFFIDQVLTILGEKEIEIIE